MTAQLIEIDGATGEGGGQIVRSSLTLSMVTGRSVRIRNIRAGRKKSGLLRQHLTAVRAAAELSSAEVSGDEMGSACVEFHPGAVRAGDYEFAVGTAGSATLVLQTILLPLLQGEGRSRVLVQGGTHNPMAPPFDYLDRVFLPMLARMGADVSVSLVRPGFYPAGGGCIEMIVEAPSSLRRVEVVDRGEITARRAVARVANLPLSIAKRELDRVGEMLSWPSECLDVEDVQNAAGPGNVLTLEIASEHVTELFTGFGQREVRAETVGTAAAKMARGYLGSGVPVGPYLADQLLIPMAMAGGGVFRTMKPTPHCRTNMSVIKEFLDIEISCEKETRDQWRIGVGSKTEQDHEV